MGKTILAMEGIEKRFPGVHALKQCRFDLRSGEVHALVGENGAGKSTMMKILTGVYSRDGGTIVYNDQSIEPSSPKETQDMGICIVHQELNLMPDLTVAQNIFVGREPKMLGGLLIDEGKLRKDTEELFKMMNLNIDPTEKTANLSVAKQQMVEIAKALSFDSKILIMDEPTASLTDSEIVELFRIINDLREKGVGIVYISHRMDEIKQISDRVTVMRDGEYIDTVDAKTTSIDEIISLMVGRTIFEPPKEQSCCTSDEVVLEVKNLCSGKAVKDVSFQLKKGEILGFAGLMGAGRTEVARAIFGADPIDSGEIIVKGKKVTIKNPQDAVKAGIGYLSEDRKRYGAVLDMSVADNTVMAALEKYTKGLINDTKIAKVASEYIDVLKTKTPSTSQKVRNLSGGNQQKVIIAKWLVCDSEIIIFDEPTRGIDIGAKSEIYKLMTELAEAGKSIIMISSELPEVLRMSDRIVVMCEGRKTGEIDIAEASQEKILQYATMRD